MQPSKPSKRQAAISDLVWQCHRVSVESLAARFATSPETIRRDLTVLARSGQIRKVHGGATLPRIAEEGPFAARLRSQVAAKRLIAKRALPLVSSGDTLFLNTGSTTLLFADQLTGLDSLTVITNSAEIARVLSAGNASMEVFLLGGAYQSDNRETYGPIAIEQLGRFRAHRAFLTVGSVEATAGVMDYNSQEAELSRAMIRHAGTATLLVDSSKFGQLAPFTVAGFDRIDSMVCERMPQSPLEQALARQQVEIVC